MTGETRMSSADAVRKRQTVQTARLLAECFRRYGGTCSCSVNDDSRRRRPGRLDTGTSWFRYGGAKPFNMRYAMSACLKLTRSGRRSQCSITSVSDFSGCDAYDFMAADGARCPASATCMCSFESLFITTVTCVVDLRCIL